MLLLSLLAVLINYAQSTDYINDKLYVEFVGASDKFKGEYEWVDDHYPAYKDRQIHGYYKQVTGTGVGILVKLKWTYKVDSTGNTVLDEPEYGWRVVDTEGMSDVDGCIGGSAGCTMSSCGRVTVLTQRPEECAGSISSPNGNPIIRPIGNEIPLNILLPEQPDDLCIIGPSLYGGGQYEYKGNTYPDGKPYWQNKECGFSFYPTGTRRLFLSYNKDSNKYYISHEIGKHLSEEDYKVTFCSTLDIDSPLDCKSWTVTNLGSDRRPTAFNFAVYAGYCPNVLGDDEKFTGIDVKFPDIYEDLSYNYAQVFNGKYAEIGLNMFKKTETWLPNPVYMYFDPYGFQWIFGGSYNRDENEFMGADSQHFTCPYYSRGEAVYIKPFITSPWRNDRPILTNINEVFQQFNDDTLSYKVPLPILLPWVKEATEFVTLTVIEA